MHINQNTYISVGLLIVLLGGFAWVIKGQSDNRSDNILMKSELIMQAAASKNELSSKIDKLETRMLNVESAKNTWTSTDMFKWAVHLQQSNPQIKVPEPEVSTK